MIRHSSYLLICLIILGLPACGSRLFSFDEPTATPTFVLARFTTATPTPTPGPTTPPPATATPTAQAIAQGNTSPLATPGPADEEAIDEEQEEEEETQAEEGTPAGEETPTGTPTPEAPTDTPTPAEPTDTPTPAPPTATPTPTPAQAPPTGRIAFPVDDGGGHYDVWVMELPDGDPFFVIDRARQPAFSSQGQLLVNNEQSPRGEEIGLLDSNYAWLGLVSESPEDSHPYWSSDGARYVYDNPTLLLEPITQNPLPHLFIPCSLRLPREEQDIKCQDTKGFSKITPGAYPVWTDDDRIAFFSFSGDDGVYVVPAGATQRGLQAGAEPQPLAFGNGRPNSTQGFRVYFSAGSIDQNWEAYAVNLDGSDLINLSNSPDSQDGLPAVSPDGQWVAFVSDRGNKWGIWLVPSSGGEPELLLDLTTINTNPSPWGVDDRDWTTERISWGP